PCRNTSRGTLPFATLDGIWITPSRWLLTRPSGPLVSEVVTPSRGRAVSLPSSPSAAVETMHPSPVTADAKANPAMSVNWRRVICVFTSVDSLLKHRLAVASPALAIAVEDGVVIFHPER